MGTTAARLIRDGVRAVTSAVFPLRCAACGKFPGRQESVHGEGAAGAPADPVAAVFAQRFSTLLCMECETGFVPIRSPLCTRCGLRFDSRQGDDHMCGGCLQGAAPFDRARAAGLYQGTLLELVHRFKYRGRTALARPLGWVMYAAFTRHWDPAAVDAVVPVPLHVKKLRRRGFNQSFLLTRPWKITAAAQGGAWQVLGDTLVRHRYTAPQTGLGRRERAKNIRGAFVVKRPESVRQKRVLLVDDVYTTGATARECARVLMAAGAKRVDVLTLARA